MRRILFFTVIAFAVAHAGEVYRWVDENGTVHFSDMPRQGAERVVIPEASTFTPPPVRPSASAAPRDGGADAEAPEYERVEIASPEQEETLWNIEGQLNVSVDVDPALQPGHRLRLLLNGEAVDSRGSRSTSFTIQEVWRGTHTLQAQVVDQRGQELLSSQTRTFFVQQSTATPPPIASPAPGPR